MLDYMSRLRPCQRITAHGNTMWLIPFSPQMDSDDDTTADPQAISKGHIRAMHPAQLDLNAA